MNIRSNQNVGQFGSTYVQAQQQCASQLNSSQSISKATSVGVRHSSHVFQNPTTPLTTTNFSTTSRAARELKFGTDTH